MVHFLWFITFCSLDSLDLVEELKGFAQGSCVVSQSVDKPLKLFLSIAGAMYPSVDRYLGAI